MATVETLLKRSLRLINVQDSGEAINSSDAEDAIVALNNMMARWEEDGVAVGWAAVSNVGDTVPAPNSAHEAIAANLAVRIAPEYERVPSVAVGKMAVDGYADLQRDSIKNSIEPTDMSHLPNPTGGRYDINSDQ